MLVRRIPANGEKKGEIATICINCAIGRADTILPGVCTQRALEKGHRSPGETRVAPCELHFTPPGCSQKLAGYVRADGVVGAQPAPKEENWSAWKASLRLILHPGIPTQQWEEGHDGAQKYHMGKQNLKGRCSSAGFMTLAAFPLGVIWIFLVKLGLFRWGWVRNTSSYLLTLCGDITGTGHPWMVQPAPYHPPHSLLQHCRGEGAQMRLTLRVNASPLVDDSEIVLLKLLVGQGMADWLTWWKPWFRRTRYQFAGGLPVLSAVLELEKQTGVSQAPLQCTETSTKAVGAFLLCYLPKSEEEKASSTASWLT